MGSGHPVPPEAKASGAGSLPPCSCQGRLVATLVYTFGLRVAGKGSCDKTRICKAPVGTGTPAGSPHALLLQTHTCRASDPPSWSRRLLFAPPFLKTGVRRAVKGRKNALGVQEEK